MKLKLFFTALLFIFLFSHLIAATEYVGNNLLLLLGTNTGSKEFKPMKEFWLLDNSFENTYGGIKLSVNAITGNVQNILIAGENFQLNKTAFYKCTSALPYGILLNDDTAILKAKLGEAQKLTGRNAVKFYQDKIAVEVSFTNEKLTAINCIRFFYETKTLTPLVKVKEEKPEPAAVTKNEERRRQFEKSTFNEVANKEPEKPVVNISPFKKAILDVFKSYRESNFASIKSSTKTSSNFWNYKFVYNTTLKIPGEKFNMIYSFPFIHSPPDFVSIIKEGDTLDQSFFTAYKAFEKKMLENLTPTDGWTSSCLPNKESRILADLEFRNDKYGSVILDYSKSPKGRSILYLRFLLYSN
jgi:hypothetical protein